MALAHWVSDLENLYVNCLDTNHWLLQTESLQKQRQLCVGGSIFCLSLTEQAAGVYHRESRKGRYQLTYKEAKAVCKYEGGKLATYEQLEAARQIGLQLTHIMQSFLPMKIYPRKTSSIIIHSMRHRLCFE